MSLPTMTASALVLGSGRTEGLSLAEFEALAERGRSRVYRVLRSLLRDDDLAGTLTQECLLRAYQRRHTFRGEASPDTWLVSIAVNLARDQVRSRRWAFWRRLVRPDSAPPDQGLPLAESCADSAASPERALAARQELEAVWAVVADLSSQQRTVFLLRFVEEMSLEEIAAVLRLTTGTVKVHLHRATGTVRARLAGSERRA